MTTPQRSFTCLQCQFRLFQNPQRLSFHTSRRLQEAPRPSIAPKPTIDHKHIRQNVPLYEQTSLKRNYKVQAHYPARITNLFEDWQDYNQSARGLRTENNQVIGILANRTTLHDEDSEAVRGLKLLSREQLLEKAKILKGKISVIEEEESKIMAEIETLALALPNLTSNETPDEDPTVRYYIKEHPNSHPSNSDRVWRSHVHIGSELDLLDFEGAATTSGWGWYFLTNEAADLEQALVQYALSVARKRGWKTVSPPSMVYSHIASACGFQPRDQNGESQIYNIQQSESDIGRKPGLSLAGTAEIPLAGMKASKILEEADLPMKRVGVSRCYRAEAGARGVDTKGLYRVHEFTKVEMFAWTMPSTPASYEVFDEMLSIQTTILESLDLHCRVLEMPATDLGKLSFSLGPFRAQGLMSQNLSMN
jgi:seryl-tRNA synthetase